MEEKQSKIFFLSGNMLKLIALVSMTIDHVGYHLYPSIEILRIIGRIAFPIFAYMVAEGCFYTRNKEKHLGLMWAVAVVCQVVMSIATGNLQMCIFVTFALSTSVIYVIDKAIEKKGWLQYLIASIVCVAVLVITAVLPSVIKSIPFGVEYGIFGVLLPVAVRFTPTRPLKLASCAMMLIFLCLSTLWTIQWYCLIALIPLAFYSGKRGKLNLKYLFYIYYPAHIVVIMAIKLLIK
ncbi:MAG: hypothetical protein IJ309_04105 [Clostridia bacterium]|nr:hypothetical protein [Clostridia bacterium]MBQ8146785.1 hypothetical protein [Clostridia bacterium]